MSEVSNPLNGDVLKRAFVQTYETQQYKESWDAVEQYETVLDATAKHPQKGSAAISSIVDLPRERIRSWVDGDGMPDQYRGLQRVLERGWLPESWSDDTMVGLNALVATVFAGGSISSDTHAVRFTITGDNERAIIEGAARLLDFRLREVAASPVELKPARDGVILGRLLAALGAPVGDKNPKTVDGIPPYLAAAPRTIRRDFARIYVQFRATDGPHGKTIQMNEQRSESYYESIVTLLRDVTTPDEVHGSTFPIRLSGDAAVDLIRLPPFAE